MSQTPTEEYIHKNQAPTQEKSNSTEESNSYRNNQVPTKYKGVLINQILIES